VGSPDTSSQPARGIAYQPALDGVRALAVGLVLLFHHGFSWMTGGYVGVSVFFTLSGYLITSLLLTEHDQLGRISLVRFYGRRVRRLLPASLLCLVGIAMLAAAGEFDGLANLRREVVAAVLQVANWNFLVQGDAYAAVQGVRSPVLHFWSLAVEEQFYWLWPLAMAALLRLVGSRRGRRVVLIACAGVGIVAAPVIAQVWGPDVAYLSTPARLGEILVGAALAGVLHGADQVASWLRWMALPALAAIVAAAIWWPAESGPAYEGWLGAGSLVSAALILSLQRAGAVTTLLSLRPLVALGRISYGVYLYHWPIFLVLDGPRLGNTGWWAFTVRVAVTLAVASLSYVAIERPIRGVATSPRRLFPAAAFAMAVSVLIAAVAVAPAGTGFGASDDDLADVSFAQTTAPLPTLAVATTAPMPSTSATPTSFDGPVPTAPESTVLPTPSRPVRILVLGDSTAMALSVGLVEFAKANPTLAQVEVLAQVGCGFVRGSDLYRDDGSLRAGCDDALDDQLPIALRERTPDVVVALVTLPDATPRLWSAAEGELYPEDARYQERMTDDYAAMRSALLAVPSVRIAWLTTAVPASWYVGYFGNPLTVASFGPLNATVASMDDADATRVRVVPFGEWLTEQESDDDTSWRSDGLHLDPASAERVVEEFLWPELLGVALS